MEFEAELLVDGQREAGATGADKEFVWNTIMQYAVQYFEDGFSKSFEIKFKVK